MTTQDKIVARIGIGGFPGNRPRVYPTDRLVNFLNVDPNKEEEVRLFCNKYVFIPRALFTKGIVRSFKIEQTKLKNIAEKLANGNISEKDQQKINRELGKIHREIRYFNKKQLSEINGTLGGETNLVEREYRQFQIVKRHSDSIVSLWEDLVTQFINKQAIRQCLDCGRFFKVNPSAREHKYCNDSCRDRYNKRKLRKKVA